MEEALLYPKNRWLILVSFAFTMLAAGLVMIAPSPMVGVIAKEYGISVGQATGIMMGSLTLVGFFSAFVGGALVDKFGYAPVAVAANALMIIGTVLLPIFCANFIFVIVLRVIQGIGTGLLVGASAAIAVIWFPKHQRGIVTGVQGMTISLGVTLAFAFVPIALTGTGNWASANAFMSISPAVALILAIIALFIPKPPEIIENNAASGSEGKDMVIALKQPITYIGIVMMFVFYWLYQAFNDLTPGYYSIDPPIGIGYGIAEGSKYMGIMTIAFLIGSILSGFILQKIFKGIASRFLILAFALNVILIFSIKFPVVYGDRLIALIIMILIGLFMSFLAPVINAFVSLHYPSHIAGKIGGMWTAIGTLGGTIGITVGASFLHFTGNYHASITTVSIVAIVGLILSFFFNPPKAFTKFSQERSN